MGGEELGPHKYADESDPELKLRCEKCVYSKEAVATFGDTQL